MLGDGRLVQLGEAISDGTPINWDELDSDSDAERAILKELRVVADIVELHRQLPPSPDVESPPPASETATGVWEEHWGHLRLLEKIGYGAFGDVYRAWDSRLDREVALKLLRKPQSSAAAVTSSVIEEGRMLARVRHPHVVTVFGAERIEGRVGVWMEFIRGRTLEQLVRDRGVFGAREAMLIGIDLCRALSAVHRAGLLHRDIKAQNVMREDGGRIVLMDFGTGREQLRPGPELFMDFAGTPLYLAPEVLHGRPATAQSDVYGLGVLLFRIVTGEFPVRGRSLRDVSSAHDRGQRVAATDLRPDLPDAFVQILHRALASDPGARFETAGAMEQALLSALSHVPLPAPERLEPAKPSPKARRPRWEWVVAGVLLALVAVSGLLVATDRVRIPEWVLGRTPAIRKLAVLPFVNQSGDPNQEYVADGITEILTTNLANIGSLQIISATSARLYKNAKKPIRQIAEELGVDAVVEGSIAREGDVVRLTVRLIRPQSDTPLWSRTYDRSVVTVMAFQSEVARAIADAIAAKLTPQEQQRLTAVPPASQAAQDAYLRGHRALNGPTREDVEAAVNLLKEAVRLDPGYALAHVDLADAYIRLANTSAALPRAESVGLAKAAALKALELDPNQAGAHAALARAFFYFDWDWPGAGDSFKRALQLNPSSAEARGHYAFYLVAEGRLDEAVDEVRRARDLDPRQVVRTTSVAGILFYAKRYPEAIAELTTAVSMDPTFTTAHFGLGRVYAAVKRYDDAIAELQISLAPGREVGRLAELARVYAEAGRRGDAQTILDEIATLTAGTSARISPDTLAYVYVALGETDRAFELLQAAANQHSSGLLWLKVDPRLDPIRGDSRFPSLLARVGLSQ